MKKVLSLVLAVVMLASTLSLCFVSTFTASAEEVKVVMSGQKWQWLAWNDALFSDGSATIPAGALTGTDSETWNEGNAPFGEGKTTDMGFSFDYYVEYASLLRTTFDLADTDSATVLKLFIKYDENPTVYLNGEVVYAVNEPGKYVDSHFVEVDLSEHLDKLVDGTNYFCIAWEESFGGSVLDAELVTDATLAREEFDESGYIIPVGADRNFGDLWGLNAPENAIDWNAGTVCGWGGSGDAGYQVVTVKYAKTYAIGELLIRCKWEGEPVNEDGSYGTYDIFAVKDGVATKMATNVPAMPPVGGNGTTDKTDGVTITFDEVYEADTIQILITSWTGPGWACVADFAAKPAEEGAPLATTDCEGNPMIKGIEKRDFNAVLFDMIDGSNNSCAASHPANIGKGRVQMNFVDTTLIDSIYVESKNEGMDQLEEGDRVAGTYDIYVVMGSAWNKVATNVPATPDGYTVEFDKAYNADGIAIIVTSWKNDKWTTISELHAFGAEEGAEIATTDVNGDALKTSIELTGIANFGWYWNDAHHLFDGHYDTMTGQGFNDNMSFTVNFAETQWFDSIKTVAKAEGFDGLGENCFGKANYYVIKDGVEILVAEGVEVWAADAVTAANKAAEFVTFDATEGEAIKVVITEWNSAGWAGFAEMDYTTTEAPAEDTTIGDFNGDETVTIGDVTALLDMIAGKADFVAGTDLNDDGNTTIGDVTALLDMIAGK